MTSLFEFHMAALVAECIATDGKFEHDCEKHKPFGIGEIEDTKYRRYDPDGYDKLKNLGMVMHPLEIEDIDNVAAAISALSKSKSYVAGSSNDHFLKHAIAARLEKAILIADGSLETNLVVEDCKIFGNRYYLYS